MTLLVYMAVLAGIVIAGGLRVVPERERLALLRLGRYAGVRGPGLVWTLPVIDRTIRVDLDRDVPHWPTLTAGQLAEEIERRATASRPVG